MPHHLPDPRQIRRRLALVVAGGVAVVVVAAATITQQLRAVAMDRSVERALTTRVATRDVYQSLLEAESAQRAYLITAAAPDLERFDAARARVAPAIDQLATAVEPTADARRRLEAIRGLAAAKLAELDATAIAVRERGEGAASIDASTTMMTELRDHLDALRADVDAVLRDRQAAVRDHLWTGVVVVVVGSALALVALVSGVRSVRAYADMRARAYERLAALTDDLVASRRTLDDHVARLGAANAALARSNRELDTFAYVASHDLKAPLRGIASLATWIEEDLGDRADDAIREHLRLLRVRVDRLGALIDGILTYSRAGRVRGTPERVDVAALVRETWDLVAVADDDGATLTVAGELPTIRAERTALAQVWLNLIGNALKHGGGGPIEVGGARDGDAWRFWVRDRGPGIDPAFHDKIFAMFQTLAPRDRVEGTGIGLAVVRKLVDAHGGRVWVESRPGDGATFSFTWPAIDSEAT